MALSVIVLAAGQGTRMESDLPKVLHQIGGAPMLAHVLAAAAPLEPERRVVVVGHGAEAVAAAALAVDPDAGIVRQEEQLGTGHAVAQAAPLLADFDGDVLVIYGDTPFLRPDTLEAMRAARSRHDIVVLGFEPADPGRYGRLVMAGDRLARIVEFKDATEAERAIGLCNSGVVCAAAEALLPLVRGLSNDNAAGEYYLTDIVAAGAAQGLSAGVVVCDEAETLGVDTRAALMRAEVLFQARARAEAIDNGVRLIAPETVHFAQDTVLGRDAVIEPYVVFGPGVTVETGAVLRSFSHLEGCHVSRGAVVGPYARLRPGAELAEDARVGNFVEIKASLIGEGAKVPHLAYVGDADIGAGANLGAGTVTCNYDGVSKHHTVVGAGAFVGSDTMLVAPVRVGARAMTGSGSVITEDVPDGALAIGRARQINKPGLADRLMERLRALRRARDTGDDRG